MGIISQQPYICNICKKEIKDGQSIRMINQKLVHLDCQYQKEDEEHEKEFKKKYGKLDIDVDILDMLEESESLLGLEEKWCYIYETVSGELFSSGATTLTKVKKSMKDIIEECDGCPIILLHKGKKVKFKIKIEVEK